LLGLSLGGLLGGLGCALILGASTTSSAVAGSTELSAIATVATVTSVTTISAATAPFAAPFTSASAAANWLLTSLLDEAIGVLTVLSKSAASAATSTAFTVASPATATSATSASATALTVLGLGLDLGLLSACSNGNSLSDSFRLRGLLLFGGLFLNDGDSLDNLSNGLNGLALLLGLLLFAIIRLSLNLCWNLLEGRLDEGVHLLVVVVSLHRELADLAGEARGLRLPLLLAEAGAGGVVERIHLFNHLDEGGSLLLGQLAVLLGSNHESHLSHQVEGVFNLGLHIDLGGLFNFLDFGLIDACVAGVRLDVEFDKLLHLLDVGLNSGLGGDHFLLGVGGLNLVLLDGLLGLDDLVQFFLFVAQFAALG